MKELKSKNLIGYASSFVSFVLPKIDIENVDEVVLFGSVVREEADKKSDVDIFFNIKNKKKEKNIKEILNRELKRFYKSKIAETWILKGIKNPIKFEIGNLDKWKLKRSIISEGIVLYGKYKEMPEKTKGFVFFQLKPIKNITKRNRVLRKLFGRKEKNYFKKGLVKEMNGKKLSANSFIVPIEKTQKILKLLNSENLDFVFFEFWSDDI